MSAEIIEHPREIALPPAPPDEERIVLESSSSPWQTRARCQGAYEEELAYGLKRQGNQKQLLAEDRAVLRYFCGPCQVQELCLAQATVNGDTGDGIIGGLTAVFRTELQQYYDPETRSVPKHVWLLAINAVLDGEAPVFPEAPQPQRKKRGWAGSIGPAQKKAQERIISLLSELPGAELKLDEDTKLYEHLSIVLETSLMTASRAVHGLEANGRISKVKNAGKRIMGLKLIAA